MRGGPYNLKHKELNDFYHSYEGDKPTYNTYLGRVLRYGYTKEEAINPDSGLESYWKEKRDKTGANETGRICTDCKIFKAWGEFAKNKVGLMGHTQNCKECRNKKKQEYRLRTNRQKDKEYKEKRRKLKIGSYIALEKYAVVDGMIRENTFEVIGYKYNRGYEIRSIHDNHIERLDTGDNGYKIIKYSNCKKFYKIDKPIELVDNSKPTLLAPETIDGFGFKAYG